MDKRYLLMLRQLLTRRRARQKLMIRQTKFAISDTGFCRPGKKKNGEVSLSSPFLHSSVHLVNTFLLHRHVPIQRMQHQSQPFQTFRVMPTLLVLNTKCPCKMNYGLISSLLSLEHLR